MNEESSWNPASGCFQCPININLGQSWAGINPLPCFAAPSRGCFSVPLSAWYVPLPFVETFDDVVFGEVRKDDAGQFFAIAGHEKYHIEQSVFGVKEFIRLVAGRGYQVLFDIISGGSNKAWEDLQPYNLVIGKLTKS